MFKVMLFKDGIKYSIYAAIGFLVIIGVAIFGSPPPDAMESEAGLVMCQPSGKLISAEELNNKLAKMSPTKDNVFLGKGAAFVSAGQKYGVDPVLVAAIAMHETGFGRSSMVRTKNNPGGIYLNGSFASFPTLEAGIDYMTRNLYKNYIKQGLKTPEQIGPKYAPIGASNDPNGLNRHWVPTITKYVNQLGGLSYQCTLTEVANIGKPSASGFLRPISKQFQKTSGFGPRWGRMHKGLDFGCKKGVTPIIAAKGGIVVASLYGTPGSGFNNYGNAVLIDHGNGVQTLYAHMEVRKVQKGQHVAQGQPVGICGKTGRSTGPHLHFEIRINGGQVNPEKYIPL
ncbi:peptidase M23 [Laceyella sacchari]|uniref:Mannosyl-glycoprotein endo-beta-N-acetylglucosaminidase n=1 Tax=Laceyella tengchongensis TaxID=574699 RepID=A0AA45WPL0_9BACL|nr:peptidoglycan DD-metalloendopeptidase family protein [Laceyella tengchongensis]AUS09981.1 peptidase M23 [Laceyella sacchari]SMP22310.1 Mannosyl-glycoprotein endo-beta-N-acetylglucosaminidase [Laceyella tengchongensis]